MSKPNGWIQWIFGIGITLLIVLFSGLFGYTLSLDEKLSCTREDVSGLKMESSNTSKVLDEIKVDIREIKTDIKKINRKD